MKRGAPSPQFDAIIDGAGSADRVLHSFQVETQRRVLVCDTGQHRIAVPRAPIGFSHAMVSLPPYEFVRRGRKQLRRDGSAELRMTAVSDAVRGPTHFEVTSGDGEQVTARKLLLASGVLDELPATEGIESFDGRSVFHGPYCDGWEVRD